MQVHVFGQPPRSSLAWIVQLEFSYSSEVRGKVDEGKGILFRVRIRNADPDAEAVRILFGREEVDEV